MKLKYVLFPILFLGVIDMEAQSRNGFVGHPFDVVAPVFIMDDDEELEEEEEEDPYRGWGVGLNLGIYFGSKITSNFYNGTCAYNLLEDPDDVQCYTIEERLNLTINEINYINSYYGSTNFFLPNDSYPALMRYNPAFLIGFQMKYNFSRDAAIVLNTNYAGLKAVDQFTIQFVGTPLPLNGQADVRLFQVVGREDRLNFNMGYRQGFEINELLNSYVQIGASALGTKVIGNEVMVADRTYQLYIGANNPNQITNYQPRTKFGLGYYFSVGVELFTTNRFTADLSLGFSRDKMVLISYEEKGWNKWLQATVTM